MQKQKKTTAKKVFFFILGLIPFVTLATSHYFIDFPLFRRTSETMFYPMLLLYVTSLFFSMYILAGACAHAITLAQYRYTGQKM